MTGREQAKLTAFLDSDQIGRRIAQLADGPQGRWHDFANWLTTAQALCHSRLAGLSVFELAGRDWAAEFRAGVDPDVALYHALRATTWAQLADTGQAKVTAFLTTEIGQQIAVMASGPGGLDHGFVMWLFTVEALCQRFGISMFDLADVCWSDSYEDGIDPDSALGLAMSGEGL
jgi:hypothetical protein